MDLDTRDPRLHDFDNAHDQHGTADPYHAARHQSDNSDFVADHHAITAADKHEDEHTGHGHEQLRVDSYRRDMDDLGAKLDLGHPKDRGVTRADAYAHTTDTNKSYRRR